MKGVADPVIKSAHSRNQPSVIAVLLAKLTQTQ